MSGFPRLSLETLETRENPAIQAFFAHGVLSAYSVSISPTSFSATAGGTDPAESSVLVAETRDAAAEIWRNLGGTWVLPNSSPYG